MSNQGPAGYPDFGRYSQQAATLLEKVDDVLIGALDLPAVYVGNLQSLGISLNAFGIVSYVTVSAWFYNDQAQTAFIGAKSMQLDAGANTIAAVCPVVGNWVVIRMAATAYGVGLNFNLIVQGFTWRPNSCDLLQGRHQQVQTFAALGAGLFASALIFNVCDSWTTVCVSAGAPLFSLVVQQASTGSGLWVTQLGETGLAGVTRLTVEGFLECAPTRIGVVNESAGAVTYVTSFVYGNS